MDKARGANMPKDNIERAIKRGTGEIEGAELIEAVYEGYAPHGIGLLIEVVTDNRNRAIADIRHVLNKFGGNMAEAGAVSWQFTRKGYINITQEVDQDELFMVAADAGAEDIQFGESVEIFVDLEHFHGVRVALEEAGYGFEEASVIYDPNNPMALDPHDAVQVLNFIEKVEDLDDVQNVYSSLEMTEEAMILMEA
jgi:YebC/PmpR family DNA-binding regulatory protein